MPDFNDQEEYLDPVGYDAENGTEGPDLDFYLDLAAEIGDPVLDLACGTGFLTIPMARRGLALTGLDISTPMIEYAKQKAAGLPIHWVVGDCRTFQLEQRFRLAVMTGNAFQEFLTSADQNALLSHVHRHLLPGGMWAFETRNPNHGSWLETITEEKFWHSFTNADGQKIEVFLTQHYDAVTQITHFATHEHWSENDIRQTRISRGRIRFTTHAQMVDLLKANGFQITQAYGNWDKSSLTDDSPRLIYVCSA